MSKLSYITMCVKESLRLYPLAAWSGRLLAEDIVLSGQKFPQGILSVITALFVRISAYIICS